MKRTTIALPDEVIEKLRAVAAERRVSLGAVIRETLAERAAQYHPNGGRQPLPKAIGIFDSGRTDTAERASNGFVLRERPEEEEERQMPRSVGIIDDPTMVTGSETADWHMFEPREWRS